MSEVAVVLSGCGVFDGTEVHEASAVCVALTRLGKKPVFFAPDKKIYHEVNHLSGENSEETSRNCLVEAGRIARGKVLPMNELRADSSIEAVIFPGGFGAAKNLSSFAVSSDPTVDAEVARVLRDFHKAKKPIGMCCIAPIVAAMVLAKEDGVPIKITLGKKGEGWPYEGTLDKASEFGAKVVELDVNEVCVDEDNKLVTTPAFMYDGLFHEIFDGVGKMVEEVVRLV